MAAAVAKVRHEWRETRRSSLSQKPHSDSGFQILPPTFVSAGPKPPFGRQGNCVHPQVGNSNVTVDYRFSQVPDNVTQEAAGSAASRHWAAVAADLAPQQAHIWGGCFEVRPATTEREHRASPALFRPRRDLLPSCPQLARYSPSAFAPVPLNSSPIHFSSATTFCGRPRKFFTRSLADIDPPGSSTSRR